MDTAESHRFIRVMTDCNKLFSETTDSTLDSTDLIRFESSYNSYIDTYDSSIDSLSKLAEVDEALNLKHEVMSAEIMQREVILKLYPIMHGQFLGDTTNNENAKSNCEFQLSESKKQSEKVEQLSSQFILKYEISNAELQSYGL